MIPVNKTPCLWGKIQYKNNGRKKETKNRNKQKEKKNEKIKIQSHATSGEKRDFHDENLKGLRYISRS